MSEIPFLIPLVAFLAGALLAWAFARMTSRAERARLEERLAAREREAVELRAGRDEAEGERDAHRQAAGELRARVVEAETSLGKEREAAVEKLRLLERAQEQLAQAFRALSAEALDRNNATFLHLAKASLEGFQERAKGDLEAREKAIGELVRPLSESLGKVDEKIRLLEASRAEAYGSLSEHLAKLALTQASLEKETRNLVQALRAPAARGRWGEMQLKRVVEMAGMLEYCDFLEQASIAVVKEDGEDARL